VGEGVSDGWVLAIDFGTTNTTAAMASADGSGAVVLEIENSRYLSSVVYRDEAGQLITGRGAVRQAVAFPERAERVPKRATVAGDQVVLGGTPVPVTDLVAAVLGRVYAEAVRYHGGQPPDRIAATCPARWAEPEQARLLAAAGAAGLGAVTLIPSRSPRPGGTHGRRPAVRSRCSTSAAEPWTPPSSRRTTRATRSSVLRAAIRISAGKTSTRCCWPGCASWPRDGTGDLGPGARG
jgi:hypothetical protein